MLFFFLHEVCEINSRSSVRLSVSLTTSPFASFPKLLNEFLTPPSVTGLPYKLCCKFRSGSRQPNVTRILPETQTSYRNSTQHHMYKLPETRVCIVERTTGVIHASAQCTVCGIT
jgi:hypothetical protein